MELASHNQQLRLRLMREEAELLSSLFTQLSLLFESYSEDSASADPLFAGLDFGGSAHAPQDPALARMLPEFSENSNYAQMMRMLYENSIIAQHRENLTLVMEQLNAHLFSDEHLQANIDKLRKDAFEQILPNENIVNDEALNEDTPYVELEDLLTAEEIAELKEFELEAANEDIKELNQLMLKRYSAKEAADIADLIEVSHPITLILSHTEALIWAKVTNMMRLSIAERIMEETGQELKQALKETAEPAHGVVFEWLGLFIDAVSQALISFRNETHIVSESEPL